MTRHALIPVVLVGLAPLVSCGLRSTPEAHSLEILPRHGVTEIEAIAESHVTAGQTIYVPAYSSIYISDRAEHFDLAVTLGIRNTDRARPIILTAVGYYHQDGQLVRDYLKKPLRLAPMASAGFFVRESDRTAGVLASFLVEWVAEDPVTSPVVEAVMIGTASMQGVSFTSSGRVIVDRSPPGDRLQR